MAATRPLAKLTAPRLAKVFPRQRLFTHLDEASLSPVVWIVGPPGAGKTTLVTSYLEQQKIPCLWYQVDSGDADPASFFYYLGLAAKQAAPRIRTPLPLLTPEYMPGLDAFSRRFFEELYRRLPQRAVVVFDNYQELAEESPLQGLIAAGFNRIPAGINVMVLSRSPPPPALARLRINNLLQVLDTDALRLTLEEATGFLQLRKGATDLAPTLAGLYERTHGWAAGLVLLLEQQERGVSTTQGPDAEILFDYFAGELLQQMDSDSRQVLLSTALLPSITSSAAEQLSGVSHAGAILAELNRRNYFTYRHATGDVRYQYHPLFREFLLAEAVKAFPPEQLQALQVHAAGLLEADGEIEAAVDLLKQAQAWPEMTEIILKHAQALVSQGRLGVLSAYIHGLPDSLLRQTPWLLYWLGVCCMMMRSKVSLECFKQAFDLFRAQQDEVGSLLTCAGSIQNIWGLQDDFTWADPWIEWLENYMKDTPVFPSAAIEGQVVSAVGSLLLFRQTGHPNIKQWIDRAARLAYHSDDINVRVQAACTVVHYHIWVGPLHECEPLIQIMARAIKLSEVSPFTLFVYRVMECFYHFYLGSPQRCMETATDALAIAGQIGVHIFDIWFFTPSVYAALTQGDLSLALTYLRKTEETLPGRGRLDISHYYYVKSWYEILQGDLMKANTAAEIALDLARVCGAPIPHAMCLMGMAQVRHEQGNAVKATQYLGEAFTIAQATNSLHIKQLYWLANSYFALTHGDTDGATNALRNAFAIGRGEASLAHAWWRPKMMSVLCAHAMEHGIETEYTRLLIRERKLLPDSLETDSWPWPIKIVSLGSFLVMKHEAPLSFSSGQRKPLYLLQALIALGGHTVLQEHLTDALWPDVESDAAYGALEINLHRLRKLLGSDKAILLRDGRICVNRDCVWVDVWAFERLCEKAQNLLKQKDRSDADVCALADKIFALYQGHFLEHASGHSWSLGLRERSRNRLLRTLILVGHHWEAKADWGKAVDLYERGVAVDMIAEELYRRLMTCHIKNQRPAEALRVHKRCCNILATMLQVMPSADLRVLRAQAEEAMLR